MMQSKSQKAEISDTSGAPVVSGRATRKFITDLFTSSEHQSFSTIDEAVSAIFESNGRVCTFHECEAPSICNDVTEDVAWAFCNSLPLNESLSDWQRDYIEQTIGLAAARAFPRAA